MANCTLSGRIAYAVGYFSPRQRPLTDQEKGLVAFAVKLDGGLVKQINAAAQARQMYLNETVAALLAKGLAD